MREEYLWVEIVKAKLFNVHPVASFGYGSNIFLLVGTFSILFNVTPDSASPFPRTSGYKNKGNLK